VATVADMAMKAGVERKWENAIQLGVWLMNRGDRPVNRSNFLIALPHLGLSRNHPKGATA